MSKLTELIEELTIDYFPDNYEWQDDQFNDKIQAIIDEACKEQKMNCADKFHEDSENYNTIIYSKQPETGIELRQTQK